MVEKAKTKREYCHEEKDEALKEIIRKETYDKIYEVAKRGTAKHERAEAFAKIKEEYIASLSEEERNEKASLIGRYYHDVEKEAVRRLILDEKMRLDGRKLDQIRPIWTEVDYLPATHGSAIFTK
jgi:polyribonucleotide nucleotidyltransferase